jgi:hypothetical protein
MGPSQCRYGPVGTLQINKEAPPFVCAQARPNERKPLLQFRVLRLGFLQDGDVGIGVF